MDFGNNRRNPYWNETNRSRARGNRNVEEEELLCFGYSCKLFRDDEKANYIDREEHLIPWMGNTNLMIDRFDVRGALYDLREAESKGKKFEETASEVELKEEELCEQERYLALYHDENEQQTYQEEESKRLHYEIYSDGSQYGQVGFDYSAYSQMVQQVGEEQAPPEPISYNPTAEDDLFNPPPELNVPPGMEVPPTIKQNKVIMKTAKFIVQQGAQMEIVIKTKQAGNPMFNFLAFDNILNPYYKHAVHMIRNGRYRWEEEAPPEVKSEESSYPSLRPDLTPGVVASPRPSPNCAYSKLITKIKEKQKGFDESEIASPIAPSSPIIGTSHDPVTGGDFVSTPAPPKSVYSATPTTTPKPSYSTPRTTIGGSTSRGTPQGAIVGLVDYPSFNQTADGSSDNDEGDSLFGNAYLRNQTHDYTNIKWPPPEIQMVIDKMASYIIKNGSAFEEVVKCRRDPRFDFLRKNHLYFPYYQCKLQLYSEVYGDTFKNKNTKDQAMSSNKKKSPSGGSKKDCCGGNRAISFSIRSREQDGSVTSHSSFPVESSSSEENEEMDDREREKRRIDKEKRRIARRDKERREREEFIRKERLKKEKEEEEQQRRKLEGESSGNEDLYDIFKYAQEMAKDKSSGSQSPDYSHTKQEFRKKKAAVFLSKLKDKKKPSQKPFYGPNLPSDFVPQSRSVTQSPTSSEGGDKPPPLPPPKEQPPLPKSPSPPIFTDIVTKMGANQHLLANAKRLSGSGDSTPLREGSLEPTEATICDLLSGGSKSKRIATSDSEERSRLKSRKKHSRLRSESRSRSSSSRRDRKKRKRRKKRRSRSRSRGHSRSRSHRTSSGKKKTSSSSSRRHKGSRAEKRKKHRRHRSPSSSLPSSQSSGPETPSTLPSESDSDMDVQVIESGDEVLLKKSSRSSSVVSLASEVTTTAPVAKKSNGVKKNQPGSGDDPTSSLLMKHPSLLKMNEERSSSSSTAEANGDKKSLFNPNTSNAMAKIAQGLRAKLNAMLEKDV